MKRTRYCYADFSNDEFLSYSKFVKEYFDEYVFRRNFRITSLNDAIRKVNELARQRDLAEDEAFRI
jgi:hypothetical protein